MLRALLLSFLLPVSMFVTAQSVKIPGYTGYAIPAETEEATLFSGKTGLHWVDAGQELHYFFHASHPGTLTVSLNTCNSRKGTTVQVALAGKMFIVNIPKSKDTVAVPVGSVSIADSGFYDIHLKAVKASGGLVANINSISLSGTATAGIHFNTKTRRNAASVHLRYPLPDSIRAVTFYNEVTVSVGDDPVHTYYMACGFKRGYFGMQVNSDKERRVIFSVWDSSNEAVDRNKVADSNRVKLLAKGTGVVAGDFGNEGTGGHSHWVYNWKAGQTYQFAVTVLTDSASQTTIYTGYFYLPEEKEWKMIAAFRSPHDGNTLTNLYSFSENFWGTNGQLKRKALFGNQWVQKRNGQWKELTTASFSYDATGKAGDRIDYAAGVENGQFYLSNGGFEQTGARFGDLYNRPATNRRPVIDFTKNADSAAQEMADKELIASAVAAKQIDTTGSINGVYYAILKEGTGKQVALTDTVTVFYKGSLLADGSVFDQTKEKPATFPLNRLIKGWQLAVPLCKVGGKIRIIIPSGLAYGIRTRSMAIPPNQVLVFDVEVVAAK
jgi:FKBP-type peptidyl-prolyl cis-trans isomerase